VPPLRASKFAQDDYDRAIAKGLDRAFEDAPKESRQLSELRAVIISDLHRGARDRADDFQRSEPAYCAALGSYLERGFELWLLGDVEELWENDVDEVLESYPEALELERAFAQRQRLRRFWGNHDLDWRNGDLVEDRLGTYLGGAKVREALHLEVLDGDRPLGSLFLAHGHQGTDFSERFSFVSRLVLRHVWRRLQASQGWLSTTPATSYGLRYRHDKAMFHWANGRSGSPEAPVLIAGHTHHPVFPGVHSPRPEPGLEDELREQLEAARASGNIEATAAAHAQLADLQAKGRAPGYDEPEIDPPCYFNTGCCCFPDGDITCLELDRDRISLVRWPDDDGSPQPKTLATASLAGALAAVTGAS
jgi:UDP-2,3-diacylglucosamine pyrophosphatase LpxH